MEIVHKSGRRKKSVARVYLSKGKGAYSINGKSLNDYFPTDTLQYKVNQPFTSTTAINAIENEFNTDIINTLDIREKVDANRVIIGIESPENNPYKFLQQLRVQKMQNRDKHFFIVSHSGFMTKLHDYIVTQNYFNKQQEK